MNLEDRMRKARQCVIEKLDRFDGRDISKFCRAYEEAMEDYGIGFGENDTIEKIVEKPKVLSSPTSMDSTMEDFFRKQSILTNLGSARMEKNADEMISTKSTHVMEICKDDNEEAGDRIQETTGRTNPVDSLLEVQDQRNNEEEILETSKGQSRASIRTNGEQMPKATPSPKAQIKDASKDKKQSKVCGPSFKLSCDIELATVLKVFKELIDKKVKVTWRDILGWNKEGFWNQKKFKKRRFSQDFLGVKKDQILQGVFSSGFFGLKSEGFYSYRKFKEEDEM
ncbi:hypothetical protein L7F22_054261 [Adiantum nelumboides]|nr:hypothetical protein [Adiantum nelumboides]